MTGESEQTTDPGVKPPIVLRPWLVVLVALALYGLTLNHWVTYESLPLASQITGWDWHPGPLPWRPDSHYHPLTLILTCPLRLLPVGWRAMGLNVFTAICAALTLGVLARSVRLLPHDRTKKQLAARDRSTMSMGEAAQSLLGSAEERRLREGEEFELLSVRAAFLPAAFAVLLLAAQLTFWQNAVSGTGQMINLLVFAFLILCLLEFRIYQNDRWLSLFAFIYGAGTANSWALIGFFPCFLAALIWIKRRAFFNWRFLLRVTVWGAVGLLLYGLIPLLGAARNDASFWYLLRHEMAAQHVYLSRLPRYFLLVAALPTLFPLLFAAINWPSPEGEFSVAHSIGRIFFQVVHLVCLVVGVLMFFDLKSSPSPRARFGLGVIGEPGFLSFYYLAALSVGYFSGYVLLVFGRVVAPRFGQATELLRAVNSAVVGLLWAAAIGLPVILFYQNFLHIRDFNSPAVADFAMEMAKALPAKPSIVVGEDPARLYLAMGASQRLGLPNHYIFVDGQSLPHREYLRYLVDHYPVFRNELVNPERFQNEITGRQIGLLLAHLALRNTVYYLHPGFGTYFEQACLTPHRMGEDLHPNPSNALSTLVLAPPEIAANQAYWHTLERESLATLPDLAGKSPDARQIAENYSQILDCWGTELQKAATELKLPTGLKNSMLNDANDQFAEAYRLNTNNIVALANQQYNAHLRGIPPAGTLVDLSGLATRFYGHWDTVLSVYGPADVPDLDLEIGRYFAERNVYLQAAHSFERSLELAPDNPVGELDLAKIYIDLGLMDAALGVVGNIQGNSLPNKMELVRVKALAYFTKHDFAQADKLLTDEHNKNPKNEQLARMMAEFYGLMGYSRLSDGQRVPAEGATAAKDTAIWFKKALTAIDEQLQLLGGAPANAKDASDATHRKAEIQMASRDYAGAIITLNDLIRQEPDEPIPLLNRAISEAQINRLDAAKNDYHAVENMAHAPMQTIYYGLAEVAHKQHDKPAEIRYDKLYLEIAPHYTLEYTNVTRQLHALEGQ